MRAGKLRHRIAIEQPTNVQDAYGEPVAGWETLATLWASKEDLTGRELFASQQVNAEVTTRFTIRFWPEVSATMRINDAGTLYNIESVQDANGLRRATVLICSKAV